MIRLDNYQALGTLTHLDILSLLALLRWYLYYTTGIGLAVNFAVMLLDTETDSFSFWGLL